MCLGLGIISLADLFYFDESIDYETEITLFGEEQGVLKMSLEQEVIMPEEKEEAKDSYQSSQLLEMFQG